MRLGILIYLTLGLMAAVSGISCSGDGPVRPTFQNTSEILRDGVLYHLATEDSAYGVGDSVWILYTMVSSAEDELEVWCVHLFVRSGPHPPPWARGYCMFPEPRDLEDRQIRSFSGTAYWVPARSGEYTVEARFSAGFREPEWISIPITVVE